MTYKSEWLTSTHVIVDIETLSLHPHDAIILSVAATVFRLDGTRPIEEIVYAIDIDDPHNGNDLSDGTLRWWLAPERAAARNRET